MSTAKTWLKVVLVLLGLGVLGMCAVAGAGIYFVSRHVNTERVSHSAAMQQFDEALVRFKDEKPLLEIDSAEHVRRLRDLADLPTAASKATSFIVMAWDPDEGRIINLKLPLWIVSMGEQKVDIGVGAERFDLHRLDLDMKEMARVGPILVLDVRTNGGERVLVWTE